MPTQAPERPDEIITTWLDGNDPIDGWDNPAGPLFLSGKHAEYEITATGGGGAASSMGMSHCGPCTGSFCNGISIECF
jgi:hypothetical protein